MAQSGRGVHPQLIEDLVRALGSSTTADDVLAAVVDVLGAPYALCRVSLRRYVQETGDVEVVAVWSRRRSDIAPGVRMPLRSTSLAPLLATGRPQVGSDVTEDDGLLHSMLRAEGIRSYATAPLGDVSAGALVLSMSSLEPDAFGPTDLALVDAVAGAVAPVLARTGSP